MYVYLMVVTTLFLCSFTNGGGVRHGGRAKEVLANPMLFLFWVDARQVFILCGRTSRLNWMWAKKIFLGFISSTPRIFGPLLRNVSAGMLKVGLPHDVIGQLFGHVVPFAL